MINTSTIECDEDLAVRLSVNVGNTPEILGIFTNVRQSVRNRYIRQPIGCCSFEQLL